jgi:hypothetical protein
MKKYLTILVVILSGLIIAGCSSQAASAPIDVTSTPALKPASAGDLTRTNDEAMVLVEVTPLNLDDPVAATLDFQIAMNTHSVDLNYDLISMASLQNDAGEEVQPTKWDAPLDGHHVNGTLSFPTIENRGSALTLILRGIAGVPQRKFEWKLNP